MTQIFASQPANDLPGTPDFNICPTDGVHVVTSRDGTRHLQTMRWGFVPHWYKTLNEGPLLINARGETIAEKPAFRLAVRSRRCLIPATGFYEWTKDEKGNRLPWYIRPTTDTLLAFAGVWQVWDKTETPLTTCAIVTTKANTTMRAIHHRMPVILDPDDWPLWLGEAGHGAAPLMRAAPYDLLQFWQVDPAVNSNRATGPKLIEPINVA